jgi:hypothetical protein
LGAPRPGLVGLVGNPPLAMDMLFAVVAAVATAAEVASVVGVIAAAVKAGDPLHCGP